MKEIAPLLEQLAAKLGTTVEKLWPVLVRQATVEAKTNLIWIVVLCVVSYVVFSFATEGYRWLTLAPILVLVLYVEDTVQRFANPQYFAVKEILDAIGGND